MEDFVLAEKWRQMFMLTNTFVHEAEDKSVLASGRRWRGNLVRSNEINEGIKKSAL